MEKMHEVSFERTDDGSIRLEQQSGVDEPNMIWLHPEQLKFITRRICGMGSETASKVEDLDRKLSVITDRLDKLVSDDWFRRAILDCDDGIEIIAKLDGLVDRSGPEKSDRAISDNSASMGDANRQTRSRSNEKTSPKPHSRLQGQSGDSRPQGR